MATNINADETDKHVNSATNDNSKDVKSRCDDSNSDDDSDLDLDDCDCLRIWRDLQSEQDSMKEFLQSTIERRPAIARDIVRIVEEKNEEITREITHLIQDICEKCQQMHHALRCEDAKDEHSHGCDTRYHHNLE